jgi:hypothetical protein
LLRLPAPFHFKEPGDTAGFSLVSVSWWSEPSAPKAVVWRLVNDPAVRSELRCDQPAPDKDDKAGDVPPLVESALDPVEGRRLNASTSFRLGIESLGDVVRPDAKQTAAQVEQGLLRAYQLACTPLVQRFIGESKREDSAQLSATLSDYFAKAPPELMELWRTQTSRFAQWSELTEAQAQTINRRASWDGCIRPAYPRAVQPKAADAR